MFAPASAMSPIRATSGAKETDRPRIAAASQASTNCSKRSLTVLIRAMPISKNGRATTIPIHSMRFRSNTPSVASQTAATPPRRASPGKNTSARLLNAANKLAAALTGWLPQLSGGEKQTPLVVTLATPFVEVHHADFGARPFCIRVALLVSIMYLVAWLQPSSYLGPPGSAYDIIFAAVMVAISYFWVRWIIRRAPAGRARVEALMDATRLGKIASAQAQRLLVIRAIDDEASLIMALGAIFNYVAARAIAFAFLIFGVLV